MCRGRVLLEEIGECKKKKNLIELCTSFKNLRGIWENHQVLSSKIAVENIKKGVQGDYVKRRESKVDIKLPNRTLAQQAKILFEISATWGRYTLLLYAVDKVPPTCVQAHYTQAIETIKPSVNVP